MGAAGGGEGRERGGGEERERGNGDKDGKSIADINQY